MAADKKDYAEVVQSATIDTSAGEDAAATNRASVTALVGESRDIYLLRSYGADIALREILNEGTSQYYFLRAKWSYSLLALLVVLIGYQCWLVYVIGTGRLSFSDYKEFLNIQASIYFAQVAGMCIIVAKCLFPPKPQDALLRPSVSEEQPRDE